MKHYIQFILIILLCALAPSAVAVPVGILAGGEGCVGFSLSDANLMGVWYFENDATDESSASNDLTPVSTPTYETSSPNPAVTRQNQSYSVYLDPTGPEGFTSADEDFDVASATFSFGGWFYSEDDTSERNFAGKHASSPNYGWVLNFAGNLGDQIGFLLSADGTTWTTSYYTAADTFDPTTWTHIVFVTDNVNLRIYKNGTEMTSGDFPVTYSSGINDSSGNFDIGAADFQGSWNGNMDEVFYTNDKLTDAEILNIYTNGFCP